MLPVRGRKQYLTCSSITCLSSWNSAPRKGTETSFHPVVAIAFESYGIVLPVRGRKLVRLHASFIERLLWNSAPRKGTETHKRIVLLSLCRYGIVLPVRGRKLDSGSQVYGTWYRLWNSAPRKGTETRNGSALAIVTNTLWNSAPRKGTETWRAERISAPAMVCYGIVLPVRRRKHSGKVIVGNVEKSLWNSAPRKGTETAMLFCSCLYPLQVME